ncbi:MAG TPA: chemotaxis protein CheW [Ktedonobacterales bacterium]|nr:chemotaxis protein CheW [Ktedonobacterales bacterium]
MPDVPREPTTVAPDAEGVAGLQLEAHVERYAEQSGDEYLLFLCAGIPCAAPLRALREVLLSTPRPVFLPFSPRWMLGVFPLRMEMIGLVDPVPLLLGDLGGETPFWPADTPAPSFPTVVSSQYGARTTPTLIVGAPGQTLAWLVQAVGDIARVTEDELVTSPEQIAAARLPFVSRYVAGIYAPPQGGQQHVALDADALMADLVEGLREKDGENG